MRNSIFDFKSVFARSERIPSVPCGRLAGDFGDDWRHIVALEGVGTIRKGEPRLSCFGGERRCPPEDCGGIHGYAEMLEVIADVSHPEHEEMLQWLGGAYDAQAFSASDVKFDDPGVRWRQAFLD